MSKISEEIMSYYGCASEIDEFEHYGIKRRSGRYPWGSGKDPYQRSGDWLARVNELKKSGMSEKEICDALMIDSIKDFRTLTRIANNERKMDRVAEVQSKLNHGMSVSEIAREMGVNESSVRSWMNESSRKNTELPKNTAEIIKKELLEKHMIDVGAYTENELGVSRDVLETALYMVEAELGAERYGVGVKQATNSKLQTNMEILALPETDQETGEVKYDQKYAYNNIGEIKSLTDYYSPDGGQRWDKREYPASIDGDRVAIKYAEDGGKDMDGVILLRRGVDDLDLGNSHYAQVRILVDDNLYLKGMAMYSDDIPDGKDILFNTNKTSDVPFEKVLKSIKEDPDNPFGAMIKAGGQSHYVDENGVEHLSAINKVKEEGDWGTMSKNLSSQFLSKQPLELINRQLNETYDSMKSEYDEICSLTNPTIKRQLLADFADSCDGATVHIKAAALPGQMTHVILPLPDIKETECYAPNYENGTKLALVRYPHAGTFEIPVLTVNNNDASGKKALGPHTQDAIGISPVAATQLSGADFDGDFVLTIPTGKNGINIKTQKALTDLQNFDPNIYTIPEGSNVKPMTKKYQQQQMGVVSNLITDMTLRGAPTEDVIKAVKHSMVVIDAVKHNYDYRQSAKDNDIKMLVEKWQGHLDDEGNYVTGGASTLISKRKQTVNIPETRGSAIVDPETGKVSYKESGRVLMDKNEDDTWSPRIDKKTGEAVKATTKVPIVTMVDDAHKLSSGHPTEEAYADYINKTKALANQARIEMLNTPRLKYDAAAAKTYAEEVNSLETKLDTALKNRPKERQAQVIANSIVEAKKQAYPELTEKSNKKDLQKVQQQAINDARARVGATGKGSKIEVTEKEWNAIQAGAISDSKLRSILRETNTDTIRKMAMPKQTQTVTAAKEARIKAMARSGATNQEIADALGFSLSTIAKYV